MGVILDPDLVKRVCNKWDKQLRIPTDWMFPLPISSPSSLALRQDTLVHPRQPQEASPYLARHLASTSQTLHQGLLHLRLQRRGHRNLPIKVLPALRIRLQTFHLARWHVQRPLRRANDRTRRRHLLQIRQLNHRANGRNRPVSLRSRVRRPCQVPGDPSFRLALRLPRAQLSIAALPEPRKIFLRMANIPTSSSDLQFQLRNILAAIITQLPAQGM